jgi:8-oxo-dGTP diphosphatase
MVEVVAARIWMNDTFLICQRGKEKSQGMLWEFVGGKVEPGETKQQALVRECQEELKITLDVGREVCDITHAYPGMTIHLTLFDAEIIAGVPTKTEHNDLKWIKEKEISEYLFCPADEEMIRIIYH